MLLSSSTSKSHMVWTIFNSACSMSQLGWLYLGSFLHFTYNRVCQTPRNSSPYSSIPFVGLNNINEEFSWNNTYLNKLSRKPLEFFIESFGIDLDEFPNKSFNTIPERSSEEICGRMRREINWLTLVNIPSKKISWESIKGILVEIIGKHFCRQFWIPKRNLEEIPRDIIGGQPGGITEKIHSY